MKCTIRHTVTLFLETDTVDYLDGLKDAMNRKRGGAHSRSDAVEYLVRQHWKRQVKKTLKNEALAPAGKTQ